MRLFQAIKQAACTYIPVIGALEKLKAHQAPQQIYFDSFGFARLPRRPRIPSTDTANGRLVFGAAFLTIAAMPFVGQIMTPFFACVGLYQMLKVGKLYYDAIKASKKIEKTENDLQTVVYVQGQRLEGKVGAINQLLAAQNKIARITHSFNDKTSLPSGARTRIQGTIYGASDVLAEVKVTRHGRPCRFKFEAA